ncbi:MAG: shikimate dehydrogenase [Pirellulales bacterium]|nr:shikimate dehydrogenase [Pirellulales bacterium]
MPSSSVQSMLALLACPAAGSPRQYMIEKAFAHHDLDWRYLTFDVGPENLPDAVKGLKVLGFRGGHCDAPHKQTISALLDRSTEIAAAVGAVNLFFREGEEFVGDNTEGKGVLGGLRSVLDPAGKKIVILGAGRVARAAAWELAAAKAGAIAVVDRTESNALELAGMLFGKFPVPVAAVPWQEPYEVPAETDVLLHATTLLQDAPDSLPPLDLESLRPELLVADVAPERPHTPLLNAAAAKGCKTLDGLTIFIEQVAVSFQLWTGVDPNRAVLREAVEEYWEV